MSSQMVEPSDLFEVIPPDLCTDDRSAGWKHGRESPTYRLLRKPFDLEELSQYGHALAIWRDNNTLTYVTPCGSNDRPRRRFYSTMVNFGDNGPTLYIHGNTHNQIAKTVTFFINLEKPTEKSSQLVIHTHGHDDELNFLDAGTRCVQRIFKVPSRPVLFSNIKLSAQQSIVMATRPHPIRVTLNACEFEDDGTAFVETLEKRTSSFGALTIKGYMVGVIDHLSFSCYDDGTELSLLPLSAKVDHLEYEFYAKLPLVSYLQSLNIAAKKLSIVICHDGSNFPTDHLVELKISVQFYVKNLEIPDCVIQMVILAARANSNLKVLDLYTKFYDDLDWDTHSRELFKGLKDHKGLRILKMAAYLRSFGPNLSYLREFLSYHRNVAVTDEVDRVYTDGRMIDELYSLNRFFQGSAKLSVNPPSERLSLVATALVGSASSDFQRTGLLLSNHNDVLCELVQFAPLDEPIEHDSLPSQQSVPGNSLKRRERIQPPRAAKRVSKSST